MNLGSTCYANSALQCLHKSKYFSLKFEEELKRRETKSQYYPKITGYYQTFLEEL
jgi:ubiquitin C-terminal hydrolase